MESPGARLKKLRLEKDISLQEVHKKTKIHLDILKAIEEDSLINLNPVYIKGFFRMYCKLLGVDPRDYLPDYPEPRSIARSASTREEKPVSLLKKASLRLASIHFVPIKIKTIFKVILIIVFIIGLYSLGKAVSSKRHSISESAKIKSPTVSVATPTTIPKSLHTEVTPKGDTTFRIRLSIRAKDNCWIQLKADGRVIFQNILRKGRTETWEAKDKIELALGNAGGVDLEINGKLIPSLGRKGQVLKNIFITKEGLRIGR